MVDTSVKFINLNSGSILSQEGTNFIYRIDNLILDDDLVAEVNSCETDKLAYIFKQGGSLIFEKVERIIFWNNLRMIDSYMPQIISEILLLAYKTKITSLSKLTDSIEILDPLGYKDIQNLKIYNYKIKDLLRHLALGMNAIKVWTGNENIFEHYPVLKENGEIFYYIEDITRFCNLLLQKANIVLSSCDAMLYKYENCLYINLNLELQLH